MLASRTEFLTLGELSTAERSAWRDLADAALEPNPFFEPPFVEAAWRCLRPRGVALLVVRDGARWLACLPVQRLPGIDGSLIGWRHAYGFLSTPLIDREHVDVAVARLLEPMRDRSLALLALSTVSRGPVAHALRLAANEMGVEVAWERQVARAALVARNRPDSAPLLPAKRRADLRRRRRRLERRLGQPLEVSDRAGIAHEHERFLALEAAGWKGRNGTALATAGHGPLFLELASSFAAEDRFRLYALTAGERVVAMSTMLVAGDMAFGFKSAYDERHRPDAPGALLLHEMLDELRSDDRLRIIDSCSAPDSELVNRMMPDRRELVSFVIASRAARPLIRAAIRLRRAVRPTLTRIGDRRRP